MKYFLHIFFLLFSTVIFSQYSYDQLQDQSGGITEGYGAWGEFEVVEDAIDVDGKGTITCYHPDVDEAQLATIFFISGWGRPAFTYEKYFHFLASLGYTVINIYNTEPGNIVASYQNSLDMILLAKNTYYPNWIATNKIGLMGHSYGAGSTIWLGKQLFSEPYNWGEEGRFIFMSAPWYSLLVTPDDLRYYPENVKLVVEVNNDDVSSNPDYTWNTSERAIRAMFQLINIPEDDKDFIRVFSDPTTFEFDSDGDEETETFSYDASHFVSYTGIDNGSAYYTWDALDVYAINRVSHALIDYVFEEQLEGKNVALGNGNDEQIDMGFLTALTSTDNPIIDRSEEEFSYKCNTTWNDFSDGSNTWFLQAGCDDTDEDGYVDALGLKRTKSIRFSLLPNPVNHYLAILLQNNTDTIEAIEIFDTTGKSVLKSEKSNTFTLDVSKLEKGIYVVRIQSSTSRGIEQFIKD